MPLAGRRFFLEEALEKHCGYVGAFDLILVCAAVTLFHQRKIKKSQLSLRENKEHTFFPSKKEISKSTFQLLKRRHYF